MTFLELLRKYKGEIIRASSLEIQYAWWLAEQSGSTMPVALDHARKEYKREVIQSIKNQ